MSHDVFISHSVKDKSIADAVCARLESEKIRCWIAPRDILAGRKWAESIAEAIRDCRILVLIFSSYSNSSEQVLREVELAMDCRKITIPFRIEDAKASGGMEYYLATTHWIDALTPPLEEQMNYLADTVKTILGISDANISLDDKPLMRGSRETEPPKVNKSSPQSNAADISKIKWKVIAYVSTLIIAAAVFIFINMSKMSPGTSPSANTKSQPTSAAEAEKKKAINFPDKKFEELVRETIKKPEGTIFESDVENVLELTGRNRGITNITGVEYFKNLDTLDLCFNSISDIKPLSRLTKLRILRLTNNNIKDVSPLHNLTNLYGLGLHSNQIVDITPLENLTNLKGLALYSNQITNIYPLSKLVNLEDLDLQKNNIKDISPIKDFKYLKRLSVKSNPISDYSILDNFKGTEIIR